MATKKRSAVLDEEQVREILLRWSCGETARVIARAFGINRGTVYQIVKGLTWKQVDRSWLPDRNPILKLPRYPMLRGTLATVSTLLVQDVLRGAA